jgi:SAM-dependent methyltransferase
LGGNKLTLLGVKELIADNPKTEITIVDVGCGNGDMRTLADYGLQHNIKFNLIGVDANNFTVKHAINLKDVSKYLYHCEDIFDKPFEESMILFCAP